MSYDASNIFALILRGDIPCHRIFEDDKTLAFLDVVPSSRGHSLIIPKARVENLFSADASTLFACMSTAQKVARILRDRLKADGVQIVQRNGAVAGQSVFHLHFHAIPCYAGEVLLPEGTGKQADPSDLALLAADLFSALNSAT